MNSHTRGAPAKQKHKQIVLPGKGNLENCLVGDTHRQNHLLLSPPCLSPTKTADAAIIGCCKSMQIRLLLLFLVGFGRMAFFANFARFGGFRAALMVTLQTGFDCRGTAGLLFCRLIGGEAEGAQ